MFVYLSGPTVSLDAKNILYLHENDPIKKISLYYIYIHTRRLIESRAGNIHVGERRCYMVLATFRTNKIKELERFLFLFFLFHYFFDI